MPRPISDLERYLAGDSTEREDALPVMTAVVLALFVVIVAIV